MKRHANAIAAILAAAALALGSTPALAVSGTGGDSAPDGVWSTDYSGALPYALSMRLGHVSDGFQETATLTSQTSFHFGFAPLDTAIAVLGLDGEYFQEARWAGDNMDVSCVSAGCIDISEIPGAPSMPGISQYVTPGSTLLSDDLPVTLDLSPVDGTLPAKGELVVGATPGSLAWTGGVWFVGTMVDLALDLGSPGVATTGKALTLAFVVANLTYVHAYIDAVASGNKAAQTQAQGVLIDKFAQFLVSEAVGVPLAAAGTALVAEYVDGVGEAKLVATLGLDCAKLAVTLLGMDSRIGMGLDSVPVALSYTPTVYSQGVETPAPCDNPVGAYCGVVSFADAYGPSGFSPSASYMSDGPYTTTDTAYPVQVEYGMGAGGVSVYHPYGQPQTQKSDINSPCWLTRCNETVEIDSASLNLPNNLMKVGKTVSVRLDGNYEFGHGADTSIAGTTTTGTVSVVVYGDGGGMLTNKATTSNLSLSYYNQLTPVPFSISASRGAFQASQVTGTIVRAPKPCTWRVIVKVYAWVNGWGFAYARMSVSGLRATIIISQ